MNRCSASLLLALALIVFPSIADAKDDTKKRMGNVRRALKKADEYTLQIFRGDEVYQARESVDYSMTGRRLGKGSKKSKSGKGSNSGKGSKSSSQGGDSSSPKGSKAGEWDWDWDLDFRGSGSDLFNETSNFTETDPDDFLSSRFSEEGSDGPYDRKLGKSSKKSKSETSDASFSSGKGGSKSSKKGSPTTTTTTTTEALEESDWDWDTDFRGSGSGSGFFNDTGNFTDSPTSAPIEKVSLTASPTTGFDLSDDDLMGRVNVTEEMDITNSTSILIKLAADNSSCVIYSDSAMQVVDCALASDKAYWEMIPSSEPSLMQLRHLASGMCLPENPEYPDSAFECWISVAGQAIADTINGLVDCSSDYAAFVGFIDPTNPKLLYNAICTTGEPGADTDVILMAYTPSGGPTQLLWGEKSLLKLTEGGPFELDAEFVFEIV